MCGVAVVGYACALTDTFVFIFNAAQLFYSGNFFVNVAVFVSAVLCRVEVGFKARIVVAFQERLQACVHIHFAPAGNTTQRVADAVFAYRFVGCFQYAAVGSIQSCFGLFFGKFGSYVRYAHGQTQAERVGEFQPLCGSAFAFRHHEVGAFKGYAAFIIFQYVHGCFQVFKETFVDFFL